MCVGIGVRFGGGRCVCVPVGLMEVMMFWEGKGWTGAFLFWLDFWDVQWAGESL